MSARLASSRARRAWGSVLALLALALPAGGCATPRGHAPRDTFDGARAMRLLEAQCAFGPRVPGTAAHAAAQVALADTLRAAGWAVEVQEFTGTVAGRETPMANIVARLAPERPRRVLLCAHWDSRPWADKDPVPANRRTPVPAANDGASGVAVLLEMARHLHAAPPAGVGIDIVLFDGEDLGTESTPQLYSQGARYYAAHPAGGVKPELAILLDMVGDAQLTLPIEVGSWRSAPTQIRAIWKIGATIAPDVWLDQPGYEMTDDHTPLIEAGIPSIDIIDFEYPAWHTLADTPDKCSAASLGVVGRTLLAYLAQYASSARN